MWSVIVNVFKIFCVILALGYQPSHAAEPQCEGESRITHRFTNGTGWDFCWESRVRENLVLSDIYFLPEENSSLRVMSTARLSQLHVAYDDSDVTYNDITQYGLGGGFLITLTPQDCPQGRLYQVQTRDALCVWESTGQQGHTTANQANTIDSLHIFSVSQVGAYAYILSWTFYADGTLEPSVGATGALQRSSSGVELPFGRRLSQDPDTLWLSHTHTYYWRLDFDLGEHANDDTVHEIRYQLNSDGTRSQLNTRFTTEQAVKLDPEALTQWQIKASSAPDSAMYSIEPVRSGHRFERKAIEPYSEYDFFVTVANDCERFASQNARFNPDCLNNVLEYVNGETIENQDTIVWHRVSFHHLPRDEDQGHMHTHWDGFSIKPGNVLKRTHAADAPNSEPQWTTLQDRTNTLNDNIHEDLTASDVDNDILSYTATGLPVGLTLNARGHLHGTLERTGTYTVTVTARDDSSDISETFTWQVTSKSSSSGGGSINPFGLLLILSIVVTAFLVRRYLL